MTDASGRVRPSAEALRAAGIAPLRLGPRDGLALANHLSITVARAAQAAVATRRAYRGAQTAAALSLTAFGANLAPLSERLLALRPLPGQAMAAAELRDLLAGSPLWEPSRARRLQDPLSLRNLPQIHGTLAAALAALEAHLEIELNGASDNPAVLGDTGEVISTGNYFASELAMALDGASRAFVHVAMAQLARTAKHLDPTLSGLPAFLAPPGGGSNGFAPLMKTAEGTVAELVQAAQPGPLWPSVNALGVEDCVSGAPVAAASLARVASLSPSLSAIELIVAAQAVDLRGDAPARLGAPGGTHGWVRSLSGPLTADRPLGEEVARIAAILGAGGPPGP